MPGAQPHVEAASGMDAPSEATIKTGDGDGDCHTIAFPWELNNTDYLRRVLAQVTFALRPVYEHMVTAERLPNMIIGGILLEPKDADAYGITKHMQAHLSEYEARGLTHVYTRVYTLTRLHTGTGRTLGLDLTT